MAKLPQPRKGTRVVVLQRPLNFSYWPLYKTTRRFGLQSTLFALDPWTVIRNSIQTRCPPAAKPEAMASLQQSLDFYKAAVTADIMASRPLLLYYCFMNLAKTYALTVQQQPTFNQAQHGLAERLGAGGRELLDAFLVAHKSPGARTGNLNLFDEFLMSISGSGLAADRNFVLPNLLPQIVPGHRLWAQAADKKERFISLLNIILMQDLGSKELWLSLYFYADDLSRLGVSRSQLLQETRLGGKFREVQVKKRAGRRLLCFEQIQTRTYTDRPSDEIPDLIADIKPYLWTVVTSVAPFRRYYVYLAPPTEHPEILPQLLSIYAITYYLGSITRYRPHHYDSIIQGEYGPRIEEFIAGQPLQFIYLMASEFAKQEVTKPSIV